MVPKHIPFTLEQIKIFKTIVEEGSFKKAANKLYVSQPTISLQMQNLEKQLNTQLIERNKRQKTLAITDAGQLLLRYGNRINSLCDEVCRALHDLHNIQNGQLTIGGSQTTGTYVLPRMIGLFREQYPFISVDLQVDSTRKIVSDVSQGLIDLGIVGGEIPKDLASSVQILPYANDELALIISNFHPLAKKESILKEDLYNLNYVTLQKNSTTKNVIDKALIDNGIDIQKLKVVMELNSIEAIKNTVEAGLGSAFVSLTAIQKELNLNLLNCIKIEDLKIQRQLLLVVNPKRYQSKIVYSFMQEILGFLPPSDLKDQS
jgi:DNA-binding transcriptional LysR family regulator